MDSFIDNLKEVCRVTQEIQEKRKNTVRAFYIDRLTTGFGYYAIIFKLTYGNKLELCHIIKDEEMFNKFISCLDKPDKMYNENICGYLNDIPFILVN